MNKKPIEQAKDPLLRSALPALQRAARNAQKLAEQTGTKLVVMRDGKIHHLSPTSIREASAHYRAEPEN